MEMPLAFTTLLMGLAGGPHCIAMCGAACGGMQKSRGVKLIWQFHTGRVLGYAGLGAIAAASVDTLVWISEQTIALHPLWTFFHALVLAWGLVLLIFGRQPTWADQFARYVWHQVKQFAYLSGGGLLTGMLWALMPCGLLYSALLVASLNANPESGAFSMVTFALGTSVSLIAGPWLWLKLRNRVACFSDRMSMRLAGLLLSGVAGWAIWMDVMHEIKVWCN